MLHDKGICVIPDVMANAGGVVVSYFEWVQNMQHMRWEEDDIHSRLRKIIQRKQRGQEIVVPESPPEPERVVDLMAALEESLRGGKGRRTRRTSSKRTTTTRAAGSSARCAHPADV